MATNKSTKSTYQCGNKVKLCGQCQALLFTETKTEDLERETETKKEEESKRDHRV